MDKKLSALERRFERERKARKEAERLLESKSRELYDTNQQLKELTLKQESLIQERVRELKEARDDAMRSAQVKSAFLANMSHEIRTPLNGVLGMLKLLEPTLTQEKQISLLKTAADSGSLLLEIINDILDFSKIEADHLVLESIPFSLGELLEETLRAAALNAQSKGLVLINLIAPDIPFEIKGDPTRLKQIIGNLLTNAIKFTALGSVTLIAENTEKGVHIAVSDTGIGMDKQQITHVFEAFSQADSSTTRKFGGTGLGLAISRKLVQAMGSDLIAQCTPGGGCHFGFTVDFPVVTKQWTPPTSLSLYTDRPILLIDSNPIRSRAFAKQLHYLGFDQLFIASSTHQTLEYLDKLMIKNQERLTPNNNQQALVFIHGEPDGLSMEGLIKHLRHDEQQKFTPVIIAFVTENNLLSRGQADYQLRQPVVLSELTRCLTQIFDNKIISPTPSNSNHLKPQRFKPASILLAEDNEINKIVAEGILETLGLSFDWAANGKVACEKIVANHYDLVLMDVNMPEMDGLQAAQYIRQLGGHYQELPIIAMTALAMAEDYQKTREAGMSDHITKPLEPDVLFATLAQWLMLEN